MLLKLPNKLPKNNDRLLYNNIHRYFILFHFTTYYSYYMLLIYLYYDGYPS